MRSHNIIIAASGTGGHIYPGISIATEFQKKGYTPIFFINNNETSINIIKNTSFDYITFNISGMPKLLSIKFPIFLINLCLSTIRAFIKIIALNGSVIVAMGGYIGFPAAFAGKILHRKVFIHEQNTVAGKANRLLDFFADKIFISFKGSAKYFNSKKTIFSGYPIRENIASTDKRLALQNLGIVKDSYTVLIFGGSLGAVKLNEIAFEAMDILASKIEINVIHISGDKGYKDLNSKVKGRDYYKVIKYMHNICDAYGAADIIISRSGAGSVSEIQSLNKPAILIPYPYATDNHQFYNAREIQKEGFIEVIEEKSLMPDILVQTILKIKNNATNISIASNANKLPQSIIVETIIN